MRKLQINISSQRLKEIKEINIQTPTVKKQPVVALSTVTPKNEKL